MTGQEGRLSSSSGRAMQSSSSGAPAESSATRSTRSRKASSPHWMSSNTHDQRRLLFEQLAERPGDLLRRGPTSDSPSSERSAAAAAGSDGSTAELLHDLDHRPVADPRPVGQTASTNHPRLDRSQRFGRQPRLADPRLAHHRHQLAAPLCYRPLPRIRRATRARARGRRTHVVPALRRRLCREQPKRRHRLPLPLQRRAARPAPRPPRLHELLVPAPISTSPGGAACCNRAATFTASPVASRSAVPVTTSPVLTPIRPSIPNPATHHASPSPPDTRAARRPMYCRHPEHGHHRVTDELLHRPAVTLHNPLHPLEIPSQQHPQRLRICLLSQRRRPTTSQNSTVTVFRTSRAAASRSAPQTAHRGDPAGVSSPQLAQTNTSRG